MLGVSIVILLSSLIFLVGFFALRCHALRGGIPDSTMVYDIINASDHGQIIFDENEKFLKCNELASSRLFTIMGSNLKKITQSKFLNYLYDHAVDFDENIKNTIMNQFEPENAPDFREVIYLDRTRLCLVHARTTNAGLTLFTLIDISMGKKREENFKQLNIMNYQLMQAIQSTATGMIISNPKEGNNPVLFVNEAFCKVMHCKAEDLIGDDFSSLMTMFIDKEARAKISGALERAENVEIEFAHNYDDKTQYYTMTLSPVYNGRTLDLFIGLLSDITLLKQREAEFFQAQKLESLGQLSAGIAHDFNNILSIIGGYAGMTSKILDLEQGTALDYLGKIEAASRRGAELTRKMLTFSRHKAIEKSCVDVRSIVQDQLDLILPLLGVSIDLKVDLPDHNTNVIGSVPSIGQILMNLVINARDAMPDGGRLGVILTCLKGNKIPVNVAIAMAMKVRDCVCLTVSDTGVGMDDKTLERIFDPFFSTKEQGKGTGLGLSVVYGLVKELGGVLDVITDIGQGTKMSVYLPRSFEEVAQDANTMDIDNHSLNGCTALIAEDEPDLLSLVKIMLEDLGVRVLTAANGDEAMQVQEEHAGEIDILLTDVVMPEIDGVMLAELLATKRPETKVVFMSGYPAHGHMAPVDLPEDASFISKPVDFKNLAHVFYQKLQEREGMSGLLASPPHQQSAKGAYDYRS